MNENTFPLTQKQPRSHFKPTGNKRLISAENRYSGLFERVGANLALFAAQISSVVFL